MTLKRLGDAAEEIRPSHNRPSDVWVKDWVTADSYVSKLLNCGNISNANVLEVAHVPTTSNDSLSTSLRNILL